MFLTCKQIQKFNKYDAKNPHGISVFLSDLQRWSFQNPFNGRYETKASDLPMQQNLKEDKNLFLIEHHSLGSLI